MRTPKEGVGALASTRGEQLLEFDVETSTSDTAVVHLRGEVDHSNAWLVAGLIEGAALSGARTVTLDCRDLQFADSAFVTAIEQCGASRMASGTIVLTRHTIDCVARVFRLLGADRYLDA
jgi:anti-anti-sigma factor